MKLPSFLPQGGKRVVSNAVKIRSLDPRPGCAVLRSPSGAGHACGEKSPTFDGPRCKASTAQICSPAPGVSFIVTAPSFTAGVHGCPSMPVLAVRFGSDQVPISPPHAR